MVLNKKIEWLEVETNAQETAANPLFELQEASYAYDNKIPALDKISLKIKPGERMAILGSNGSGKSTLLKLLDGLYFPQQGAVFAFGERLNEERFADEQFNFQFRRRVGLVFQDSDVQLFSSSVWDEVAFAPLQLGLSQEEVAARVDKALQALRLQKLHDRVPHRLSGGEKKRVALASVLSLGPDVWLLDEPTAGLDPRSASWLVDFLIEQGQEGKTIITATHDLTIVEDIADRVFVLDEDHIIAAQGSPQEMLANTELLLACNLMHAHRHRHPDAGPEHAHPHLHPPFHDHDHPPQAD
jgi:cobalt/nickel transport system ATP-binding protein